MSFNEIAEGQRRAAVGLRRSEWPSEISLNTPGRTLDLVWDSAQASVSHNTLRLSCKCTECESTRRKNGKAIPDAPDVELLRIEPVGSAGLQFFFSDGHNRGIYPWPYLHDIVYGHGTNVLAGMFDERLAQ